MDKQLLNKLDMIFGRRSIRAYKPGPISDEALQTMLEAAMAAPSAVAKDPWRFVTVRQPQRLNELAAVLPHGKMLASAGAGVVVCGDLEVAHDSLLSYLLQDCSAAIENLLLAAHALGFGACWLGIHPREDRIQHVSRILGLPSSVIPVSGIAIGYPGEVKEPRTRYKASYVHSEKW